MPAAEMDVDVPLVRRLLLADAWLALGPSGRAALLADLEPDPATTRRACGWALVMGTALVTMSEPDSPMAHLGDDALAGLISS